MTDYRDGNVHQVGPIRLQYRGEDVIGLEKAACWIRTEGQTEFLLDFQYAEALASALEHFPDLFSASESDKDLHANAAGQRRGYRGRKPSFTREQLETVRDMAAQGIGVSIISKKTGLSRQAIYRINADPASAEKSLSLWNI